MCGILGCFGTTLAEEKVQDAMLRMGYRGPDDTHQVKGEGSNYVMGAVRLGFRDHLNGRQPMRFSEGEGIESSAVCLNGEIYNYQSLRRMLEPLGAKEALKTECDTELIYWLYKLEGISFVSRLRGMFTFALWDGNQGKGYLVNDYLGQKPVFYKVNDDLSISYASEARCLVSPEIEELEEFCLESLIDEARLGRYLYQKNSRGRRTIYKGINRLLPGECLEYSLNNNKYKIGRYYNYAKNWNLDGGSVLSAEDDVEALLLQAIKRRIDNTESVACYLSGGLDSSLVCALISRYGLSNNIKTFTLAYTNDVDVEGKKQDRQYASEVASMIGSEHTEIEIDASELGKNILAVQNAFDEPFSGLPSLYFVSKEISRFARYSLSGDGADELFGSYLTHRTAEAEGISSDPIGLSVRYLSSFWGEYLHPDNEILLDIESELRREHGEYGLDEWRRGEPVTRQLAYESVCLFPYGVLTYIDRLSMAHSVEPRSPFLDQDLWEYVMALPDDYKVKGGETKILLKRIASKYLPDYIVNRKKEGFVFPLYHYLLRDEMVVKSRILEWNDNCDVPLIASLDVKKVCEQDFERLRRSGNREYMAAQRLHTLNILATTMSKNDGQ